MSRTVVDAAQFFAAGTRDMPPFPPTRVSLCLPTELLSIRTIEHESVTESRTRDAEPMLKFSDDET